MILQSNTRAAEKTSKSESPITKQNLTKILSITKIIVLQITLSHYILHRHFSIEANNSTQIHQRSINRYLVCFNHLLNMLTFQLTRQLVILRRSYTEQFV